MNIEKKVNLFTSIDEWLVVVFEVESMGSFCTRVAVLISSVGKSFIRFIARVVNSVFEKVLKMLILFGLHNLASMRLWLVFCQIETSVERLWPKKQATTQRLLRYLHPARSN